MKNLIFSLLILVLNINFGLLAANWNDGLGHEYYCDSDTSKLRVAVKIIQSSESSIEENLHKIDSIVNGNEDLDFYELEPIFNSLCKIQSDEVYRYLLNNIDLYRVDISGTSMFGYDSYVVLVSIMSSGNIDDYFDYLLKSDILENNLGEQVLQLYALLYINSKYGAFDIIHYTHGSEIKAENLQRIKDIANRI